MHKSIYTLLTATVLFGAGSVMAADKMANHAATDTANLEKYFAKKFSGVETSGLINGAYALSDSKFIQWEAEEEFPRYDQYVAKGEEIYNTPFKNGKSFASCFGDDVSAVRVKYPHWDKANGAVVTLEGDINKCRTDNGEKPFGWKKGAIAHVSAYLGYEARGQKVNVVVPSDDPKAVAAYEDGKHQFYAKRGQLNLACSDCHVNYAGNYVRGNLLSPSYGHTTHFPVFRNKWSKKTGDGLGTLHRRYGGCNKQVRAKPFKAQGKEYRNLEFFHAAMSNGLEINAPGFRE